MRSPSSPLRSSPSLELIPTAARPSPSELDPGTLRRRLAYIMLVRVILFTLLLGGTVAVNLAWGTPEELGGPYVTFLFVFISFIYVLNILYALLLKRLANMARLAAVQVALDLVISGILVHFTGGSESGFVFFFLLTPIAAAVTLHRRAAMLSAAAGALVFGVVVMLGFFRWLPELPGQLPWEISAGSVGRSLLVNGIAIFAVAVLAGYLAEQLRFAAEKVEVQQAHIDDLAMLNADIIRCLTSGLVTVSDQGRILTMNQAAGEILGLPYHHASGRRLAEILPDLAEAVATSSQMRRTELTLECGGAKKLLGLSVSPLTDHLNQVRGRIINFQNLTTIREMEEVIKRTEHLASLGRMAAAIAHEIRNPLASISGSLELLHSEEGIDADDRKLMKIALREIERLNSLITSFLDYARPQQPRLEPFDLGREIQSMVEAITGLLADSEAPSVVVVDSTEDVWVNADRDQLQGVLWNLIRNAWEAGEQDQISIRVRAHNPDHVELEVHDHAQGIPPEQLEQIFEPFFTTKDSGTGLGLAMVHRIVQDHGGTIDVSSVRGEGTTFTLRLPRLDPKEIREARS